MKYLISLIIALTLGSLANAQSLNSTTTTTSTESLSILISSSSAATTTSSSTIMSSSTTTSTSTEELLKKDTRLELCEIKIKLNQRKDKVSAQIQKQLTDKNKLVSTLIAVASSSEEKSARDQIQESIIKLDSVVLDLVKAQRDIINIIASTTETPCASTTLLKRDNDKAQIKIKKISQDAEKKSAIVNSYIKNDIRELIEAVKE